MEELAVSLGTLALMGACATIAGAAEDLESDFGSQSNANSQVQLAPQVGYLHRIYNKAVCGEPVAYGLLAATGAAIALALATAFSLNIIISLALGATVASLMYGVYATTAYMGRITGQKRFGQPVYLDVLLVTTPSIIAHAFIATMAIGTFSYLLNVIIGQPFPFPILALLWGFMTGGMGSAVGDVHYGAERQYQAKPFGMGLPIASSGKIIQKGEAGLRNSLDIAGFCVKHGGPLTGLGLGLTVFVDLWRHIIFIEFANGWGAMIMGLIIVLIFVGFNRIIELWARKNYGPYREAED